MDEMDPKPSRLIKSLSPNQRHSLYLYQIPKSSQTRVSSFPFLFTLVMDALSVMFNHALNSGILVRVLFGDHRNICHFLYANDLITLSIRGDEDFRIIKLIL